MTHFSPLRYPGGKNKLSKFIAEICYSNSIDEYYIEPYSGGASVALNLLINDVVSNIVINDKDRSIYAFWYCVLHQTFDLCELIKNAKLDITEWKKQKEIQNNKEKYDLLTLGFSTFYLNRTNRSGIIKAGVMGGINQKGNYLMDCRFNKVDLINRIELISTFKNNIKLFNLDASELIDLLCQSLKIEKSLLYLDPPYFNKGNTLYLNHYKQDDHKHISEKIQQLKNSNWIVSYDNVEEIKKLYNQRRKIEFSLVHSAYKIREGKEIMFFSDNLKYDESDFFIPNKFKLKK